MGAGCHASTFAGADVATRHLANDRANDTQRHVRNRVLVLEFALQSRAGERAFSEAIMKSSALVLAAAFAGLTFNAATAETLSGYGSRTCDQWEQWHRGQISTDTVASENWVFGTLEGIASMAEADNRMRGLPPLDVLRGLDGPMVIALIGEYCRPHRALKDAVSELGAQLVTETGLVASGTPRPATSGGRVLLVKAAAPRETTGSAAVETTGTVAVAGRRGACEALIINGRTATGVPVTRVLTKCY